MPGENETETQQQDSSTTGQLTAEPTAGTPAQANAIPSAPPALSVTTNPGALPTDPPGCTYELQADGSTLVTLPTGTKQRRAPAGTHFLSKREIVAADDSGYEDVHVPEWGGWVRVKRLTAGERGKIEAAQVTIGPEGEQKWNGANMRELFCQMAMVNPTDGVRLFSGQEIHMLAAKSAAAMDRVYESATRQARVSKKDLRELEGNSDGDLSDTSRGGTANG